MPKTVDTDSPGKLDQCELFLLPISLFNTNIVTFDLGSNDIIIIETKLAVERRVNLYKTNSAKGIESFFCCSRNYRFCRM